MSTSLALSDTSRTPGPGAKRFHHSFTPKAVSEYHAREREDQVETLARRLRSAIMSYVYAEGRCSVNVTCLMPYPKGPDCGHCSSSHCRVLQMNSPARERHGPEVLARVMKELVALGWDVDLEDESCGWAVGLNVKAPSLRSAL